MTIKRAVVVLLMGLSGAVSAASEKDYRAFFDKYQKLNDQYSPAVGAMYRDDASITITQVQTDGIEQSMKMEGHKLKELIGELMEVAEQRGDSSVYKNITITLQDGGAKIKADRYGELNCFDDSTYLMVVSNKNNTLKIAEEYFETPYMTHCKAPKPGDLEALLKGVAKITNKELPIMLDSDTQLAKVSSEGSTLVYHYVLVNYSSDELDPFALEDLIAPNVKRQSCINTNSKGFLDKGATLSYRYESNNNKQMLVVDIKPDHCG